MNTEALNKDLDLLLKTAQDEYRQIAYDTKNIQNATLRTYLWLTAAVMTAEAAFLWRLLFPEAGFPAFGPRLAAGIFSSAGLAFAFIAFIREVGVLPGFDVKSPLAGTYAEGIGDIEGWHEADGEGGRASAMFRKTLLGYLETAILELRPKCNERGHRLRRLSGAVRLSISAGGLGFLIFCLGALGV